MLFCNRCGQCAHISNDRFNEYADISGTEHRLIDCVTGEIVDYGDSDTEPTGDSYYSCGYCHSDDIEFSWDGTLRDALARRKEYELAWEEIKRKRKSKENKENIWDNAENYLVPINEEKEK